VESRVGTLIGLTENRGVLANRLFVARFSKQETGERRAETKDQKRKANEELKDIDIVFCGIYGLFDWAW